MSAVPTPREDELAAFERWVGGLPERRREHLAEHIAVARAGAPWLRAWLVDIDRNPIEGVTHIPPASMLAEWNPGDDELLSVEESAAILRWLETGEGECPWPDESPG